MNARHAPTGGLLDPRQLARSLPDALRKLDPRIMWRNPVMLIVEVGAAFTTVLAVTDPSWFAWLITGWLWATVVFANLAEAVAEGRGKAQADTLRKTRQGTIARRVTGWQPGAFIAVADVEQRPGPEARPRATSWCARPATSSPATATSWRASPASTSRRSPASPPR